MIVVDTSALIAIIQVEDDAERFAAALSRNSQVLIAAPTLFETYQVAKGKRGAEGRALVDGTVTEVGLEIVDWTAQHLATALSAFDTYGKGSGHSAKLNFGDCMSYALAKSLEAPLLYKGDDFAKTDIRSALL